MNKTSNTQSPTAFDPTKPVQTRDGRKARIICTDCKHRDGEIVVLVQYPDSSTHAGAEEVYRVHLDGYFVSSSYPSINDLVNVPVVTTKIENFYKDASGRLWGDYVGEERRDKWASSDYMGYIEWTFHDDVPVSCRFVPDVGVT